jgi:hypothetical protein
MTCNELEVYVLTCTVALNLYCTTWERTGEIMSHEAIPFITAL